MDKTELYHLADIADRIEDLLRGNPWDRPAKPPCGYVNRAGDVTDCAPDHDTAEDIRARLAATGGYVKLPLPVGLNWHGSDYRRRGTAG